MASHGLHQKRSLHDQDFYTEDVLQGLVLNDDVADALRIATTSEACKLFLGTRFSFETTRVRFVIVMPRARGRGLAGAVSPGRVIRQNCSRLAARAHEVRRFCWTSWLRVKYHCAKSKIAYKYKFKLKDQEDPTETDSRWPWRPCRRPCAAPHAHPAPLPAPP